jgi:iron(III) transport system substrate-binding protein
LRALHWSRTHVVLPLAIAALVLVGCTTASPPSASQGTFSSALDDLIAKANQEGTVVFNNVARPENIVELQRRFNERFGTDITVEHVPLSARDVATRLRQEADAGRVTIDVANPSTQLVLSLVNDGVDILRDPIDWEGVFGEELEGLDALVERVPEEWRGSALEHQTVASVVIYNTESVPADDVPKTWDDLLDPRWAGRNIAADPRGSGIYLNFIHSGPDENLAWVSRLIEQDPLWIEGGGAIAEGVARNEAPIGITALPTAIGMIQQGGPIAIAALDYYPAIQQLVIPVEGSPNPNAAVLFAGWLAAEGVAILSDLGDVQERAWPELDNTTANALRELGTPLEVVMTLEDIAIADEQQTQIADAIQQSGLN